MTVSDATYCTREQLAQAPDVAETARNSSQLDRAIEAAREGVEGLLRRRFVPTLDTRYFRWPSPRYRTPWRLWLDDNELVSLTTLTAGGTTITSADYFLEPNGSGPPYRSIEVDQSSSSTFKAGDTSQQAIAATGLFGYTDESETVGSLAATLAASTSATASVTWTTTTVGVGSLLRINDERMVVVGRTMVDSTQTLQADLAASKSGTSVSVTDGTGFAAGQTILMGSERMLVVDVSGNTLTVRRAWDGTALAAHSGAAIYSLTGVTLKRAAAGTTLAAHSSSDSITRWVPPPLVRDLAVAYALTQFAQEQAGYARTAGSGDHVREVTAPGLRRLEERALERHGRRMLTGAV